MEQLMRGGTDTAKRFQHLMSEISQLSDDIAEEIGKTPAERSTNVIGPFRRRSEKFKHEMTMIVHGACQDKARLILPDPDTGEALATRAELQSLQDIINQGMFLRGRFDQIIKSFEHQLTRPGLPLYDALPDQDQINGTLLTMLGKALTAMDLMANPNSQSDEARELGCFPDIRLNSEEFLAHALAAYRVTLALGFYNKARFLDVGCGGGGKVLMASQLFTQADGIEFDPAYAQSARELVQKCDLNASEIFELNALEFDGYENYEIVYFFQPMRNTKALHELERRIVSSVRPGTVLIAPYLDFRSRAVDLGCRLLDGHIFIAGASEEIVDQVRAVSESTGVRVVREIVSNQWDGVWRPAKQAFAANGFYV